MDMTQTSIRLRGSKSILYYHHPEIQSGGCPRGVMVKALDCGIVVREFYYVHFRANTLGKGMNTPYPPSYGLNSTTTVL